MGVIQPQPASRAAAPMVAAPRTRRSKRGKTVSFVDGALRLPGRPAGAGGDLAEWLTRQGPTAGAQSIVRTAQAAERSEEHTSELQSRGHLVCRLLLEKKKTSKKR